MNLLHETLEAISCAEQSASSIVFIGSVQSGHSCDWGEFEKLADREYEDGYGSQKVATDLTVIFSDGTYMTRHEYDGSENWDIRPPLEIPKETKPIKSLFVSPEMVGWESLASINEESA